MKLRIRSDGNAKKRNEEIHFLKVSLKFKSIVFILNYVCETENYREKNDIVS